MSVLEKSVSRSINFRLSHRTPDHIFNELRESLDKVVVIDFNYDTIDERLLVSKLIDLEPLHGKGVMAVQAWVLRED